jgi:diketogulonate reductase-like aldo/keto reductase
VLDRTSYTACRWVLQNNISELTLAVAADKKSYLVEDIDVFNWSLSDEDMHRLNTEPFAPEDPTRGTCKA